MLLYLHPFRALLSTWHDYSAILPLPASRTSHDDPFGEAVPTHRPPALSPEIVYEDPCVHLTGRGAFSQEEGAPSRKLRVDRASRQFVVSLSSLPGTKHRLEGGGHEEEEDKKQKQKQKEKKKQKQKWKRKQKKQQKLKKQQKQKQK